MSKKQPLPSTITTGVRQEPSPDLLNRSLEYVQSENLSHQEYSLRVLINCTLDEKYRHIVYEKTGEQVFINLFQSESEVVQMLAAWLLSHITLDEGLCTTVVQSKIGEHFISLLYSDNADVQEKVLWVCNNILFNEASIKFVKEFEVIDKLTTLLNSTPPAIMRTTANILESLMRKVSCPSGFLKNQETFVECDGISAISDVLAPAFPPHEIETLIAAVDLLSCLALYDAKQREVIVDSSSFAWILAFIANPTTHTKLLEKSLQIVYNISIEESLVQKIVDRGSIPILVARLNANPASSLSLDLNLVILANLIVEESTRISSRKHGFAPALIRIIHLLRDSFSSLENCDDMEKTVMEIVGNAACDEFLRMEFNHLDAVEHFKHLVTHKNPEVSEMASTAIENLNIPVESNDGDKSQGDIEEFKSPILSNFTVREMVDSEQAFVNRIGIFIRVYLDPLEILEESPIPKELISLYFLNIREIFAIHAGLLSELKNRFNSPKPVWNDLFVDFAQREDVREAYRKYITGFETSLNLLADQLASSPSFEQYLSSCDKNKDCNGLNFAAFLLMPVQRINRYSLFLKEIQSATQKEDLTGALAALQALEKELTTFQNEAHEHAKLALIKKGLVGISKAFLLEAQQECLYDGLVVEYLPSGSRHVQIFLFSDIMIICCFQVHMSRRKKNKKKISTTESKIKMQMDNVVELSNLEVIELPSDKATGQHMLKLKWAEGESILYMTDSEKQQWVQAIAKAKLTK